jgi:hypothetical protein
VDVVDVLGLNTLLAQLIIAIGLAMVLGNAYAIYKHRKGEGPRGAHGEFRPARAYWLLAVGAVITIWGAASVLS